MVDTIVASRQAAIASLQNAAALLADAELLIAHHRPSRALGLARLGREEYAKGFLWALASLDLVRDLRDRMCEAHGATRDHRFKQSLASMAGAIHHIIDDQSERPGGMLDPEADVDWCLEVLPRLAEWVEKTGVAEGFKQLKQYQNREDRVQAQLFKVLPEDMDEYVLPTKDDAFYVDLDEDLSVLSPMRLTESDAETVIVDLKVSLRDAGPVLSAFSEDDSWHELLGRPA